MHEQGLLLAGDCSEKHGLQTLAIAYAGIFCLLFRIGAAIEIYGFNLWSRQFFKDKQVTIKLKLLQSTRYKGKPKNYCCNTIVRISMLIFSPARCNPLIFSRVIDILIYAYHRTVLSRELYRCSSADGKGVNTS